MIIQYLIQVLISFIMVKMEDQSDVKALNRMKNYYNMNIDELTDDIEEYLQNKN